MPNLKLDLLNKLKNDKYYEELELIRLAADPNMNYAEKIELMDEILADIAILNAQMGLVDFYFQEQPMQQQVPPQQVPVGQPMPQQPKGQVHNGQTHGE